MARGGLVGNRGPGETQLEVDRRRILRTRAQAGAATSTGSAAPAPRSARRASGASFGTLALVGYTNAGKSTLLNRLTHARGARARTACSRRSTPPPAGCASPAARPCCSPTPSGSCGGFRTSSSRRSVPRSKRSVDADLLRPRRRRLGVRRRGPDRGGAHGAARDRRRRRCPSCSWSTRPTSPIRNRSPTSCAVHPGAVAVSAATGDGVEPLLDTIGGAAPRPEADRASS